ncbi:MAG: hypothetical protein JWM43_1945 [Acidobacteriaceae bacterium]|nr:hypothetical protein [Acidobacteriaceae bacterium]
MDTMTGRPNRYAVFKRSKISTRQERISRWSGGIYGSGFQPSVSVRIWTQAFGLGWYVTGRWP